MKTINEISSFYKQRLTPSLIQLDKQREKVKSRVNAKVIPAIFIFFIIEIGIIMKYPGHLLFNIIGFLFVSLTLYLLIKKYYTKNYVTDFKNKIIAPLITYIDSTLVYRKDKFVSQKTFEMSKIEPRKVAQYNGKDFVYGNINGVNLKFSAIDISVYDDDDNDSDIAYFGLFIVAEFNKHLKAHTIVRAKALLPFLGKKHPGKEYKKIIMDYPLFNERFDVFSTDEIEPRYILSPVLMEKILTYTQALQYPTTLSFIGENIYIINNCGEILEPTLQRSLLTSDPDIATTYAKSLYFALSVIETLNLDRRIWSKV